MKITIEDASKILGCSYTWAYNLYRAGRIELNKKSLNAFMKNKSGKGRPRKYGTNAKRTKLVSNCTINEIKNLFSNTIDPECFYDSDVKFEFDSDYVRAHNLRFTAKIKLDKEVEIADLKKRNIEE